MSLRQAVGNLRQLWPVGYADGYLRTLFPSQHTSVANVGDFASVTAVTVCTYGHGSIIAAAMRFMLKAVSALCCLILATGSAVANQARQVKKGKKACHNGAAPYSSQLGIADTYALLGEQSRARKEYSTPEC